MYSTIEQQAYAKEKVHNWGEQVRGQVRVHVKHKSYTSLHKYIGILVKHLYLYSDYMDALKGVLQQEYPEGVQQVDKLLLLMS
jgi:hypothetical protein